MASLCAPPFPLVPQIFYSLFASLSFFSSGMCAGWASQTLVNTVTRTWSWGVWPQEVPWILATLELGALMASIPVGYAVDKYGRKYVNVTVGFLFLLSWLIVLGADMRPENLYSARVVAGLAMGATSIVVPIYVAEITEARARGVLLTLSKAMTLAGLLAMHALGPRVSYRSLVALSSLPVVLFLCTFSWSPESPHLLAVKERWNKATESLNSLRATPRAVKLELGDLMRKDEERAKVPLRHLPRRPVARNALLLSLALGLLAALSGHSAVTFYGALQLPPSTDPYFVGPETLCMCVAATTLAGCLVAAALVDTLGRRPLLVTSAASCTVAMAAVGYLFLEVSRCEDAANTCDLGWWLVSGLLVWAFSYGLGLFSVPCTLAVEMAPTNARGVIVATSAAFSTLGCVLATMTFEMADKHVACWVYAGCSGLCLLLAALAAPETKGKGLAAIQRDLTERYGRANLDLPEAPPAASATPGDVPLVRHNGVGRGVPLAAPRPAQPHSSRSEPPPHH